jgi:hypothetical protein
MKIDTEITFNDEKDRHLKNLEAIRWFIFGDENNQPQVTYVPKMMEFEKIYTHMKYWIETSYFEGNDE